VSSDLDPTARITKLAPHDPLTALEQLPRSAAGRALLLMAEQTPGLWLVGGFVRDALLGRRARELDVIVEGDAAAVARALAELLGATVVEHEQFLTAQIIDADGRVLLDVATARRETYPQPGALPVVEPATLEEDLLRRDFSINAMAVSLRDDDGERSRTAPHALDDLATGRLRVLHDESFIDDPTRLLRLARYGARLAFDPDEHTRLLAGRAVSGGALGTLTGARIGAELRLLLSEREAIDALVELDRLGAIHALHPRLRLQRDLCASALALLPRDGRRDLLLVAALALPLSLSAGEDATAELRAWLNRLEFTAADRDRVLAAAAAVPRLVDALDGAARASQVRAAAVGVPVEGVALAGALGPRIPAYEWLWRWRHVRLEITGEDLLAAGVPGGPEIGRRLSQALDRRLDGGLAAGREAELAAALQDEEAR
jgi:tRNA nucleotidyltransferase (CCA-adding enzyme)